jgi:hypothetical protein
VTIAGALSQVGGNGGSGTDVKTQAAIDRAVRALLDDA